MKQNISSPPLTEDEYRLCVRVAKLYYDADMTQDEIGKRLGYSRVKIHRILRQAREAGILEVRIHTPPEYFFDLENDLTLKYNLKDALVVMEEAPGQPNYLALARGACTWLNTHLVPGTRIGLGLGRTISHLPMVFTSNGSFQVTFTEIVGAASDYGSGISKYNAASKLAELSGGQAEFFYAPTFVSNKSLKEQLLAEPSIQASLERARTCQIVLQSVGPVDDSALLLLHKYITIEDLKVLHQKGAVGDALGHYFDIHGNHIPFLTDDRMIGLDLPDLLTIPWSVLIAGGIEKVKAIHGALLGKYFNVLVTDRQTAQLLMEVSD